MKKDQIVYRKTKESKLNVQAIWSFDFLNVQAIWSFGILNSFEIVVVIAFQFFLFGMY